MPFSIDTAAYDKAKEYPSGHGYGLRDGAPTSAVIHSTNNRNKDTPFASEAKFLFTAANVSSHFLVGKDGRIVQFLDPARYEAWHAGGRQKNGTWTAKPDFANPRSIGIELHHSVGDGAYPTAQIDALTWLVRELMARFHIPPTLIDTHRAIALPARRKSDPNDWPDLAFYRWRAQLDATPPAPAPPETPAMPDPLRAERLPGAGGTTIACSKEIAHFYSTAGGFFEFGFPLRDEFQSIGLNNQLCGILVCERVVIKRPYGSEPVHLALRSEAEAKGWK